MTPGKAGRAAVAVLLGVAALTAPGPLAATKLPPTLEDPTTGAQAPLLGGAQVVHLVFFGTWCPPCLEELEELADLEARWGDHGYRLVLVAVRTRHTREKLLRFAQQSRPPGTLLFDATGTAEAAAGAKELPTHLLLGRDGEEILRSGALDQRMEEAVARLLVRRGGKETGP